MNPTNRSEPEGLSSRELRRTERRAVNSEAFPEFAEPTLASSDEVDEIIELRPRRSAQQPKIKPNMRVDAAMLRGSGLLQTLPEFLGQLARANLETETLLATNPSAVRFELDEAAAEDAPHVELNLFAGVAETQRRRHARRVILPGGRPFKLPGENRGDDNEPQSRSNEQSESGDESDASTSTTASLRIRTKKRKAGIVSEDDDETQPNKIRIQYQHPTPVLKAFDLSKGDIVKRDNPMAETEADPFVQLFRARKEKEAGLSSSESMKSSSSSTSSSGTSSSSRKIIKLKLVNQSSSSSSDASTTSTGSSRDSSRASTPEYKIIRVQDSPSSGSPSSSSSTQSSPRIKIVRRGARSVSPTVPLAGVLARPTSSGSESSTSGSKKSSGSGIRKIKLINKPLGGYYGPARH